ncbi:MAG: lysophospholipid acyltransferase family protein [Fimbriimonadaceae bacterium]|nr:lysophospholipid acyltransferase family protein [Fimbriimonadaceae bacterium]
MLRGSPFVYDNLVILMRAYFRIRGGLTTYGAEHLPAEGGYIIAPNHLSYLDPPAIALTHRRRIIPMAKVELWDNPFFARIMTGIGAIPVQRGAADREAIRIAIDVLKAGEPLLLFPEGTRGDGVTLGEFSSGPMLMSRMANVPIIPAAVVGTQVVMPRKGRGRGRNHPMSVTYGAPIDPAEFARDPDRNALNRALMARIQALAATRGLMLADPSAERAE